MYTCTRCSVIVSQAMPFNLEGKRGLKICTASHSSTPKPGTTNQIQDLKILALYRLATAHAHGSCTVHSWQLTVKYCVPQKRLSERMVTILDPILLRLKGVASETSSIIGAGLCTCHNCIVQLYYCLYHAALVWYFKDTQFMIIFNLQRNC